MAGADYIIVGAGIAGASLAAGLASRGKVIVLEQESQPGYHSTGRSAAVFTEIYGNEVIRALTTASGPFFRDPPDGFSDVPLWMPRPLIMIGRSDQREAVETLGRAAQRLVPEVEVLDREEALERAPFLAPDYVDCGLLDPKSFDLDVHAIHGGFLRAARRAGAEIVTNAEVESIRRSEGMWTLSTRGGDFTAPVIVNAAGAWADEIARLAGAAPIGLVPKRRSAFTFTFTPEAAVDTWPTIIDISEEFYFKPEAGKLLGSPADETPSSPCDARPEEIDIAIAIDRITRAARLEVRTVDSRWAGLRSFVTDKSPVVGFDPDVEGFFWLAAQGGYGIQTSPALGRAAAELVTGNPLPDDLLALGISAAQLAPERLDRTGG